MSIARAQRFGSLAGFLLMAVVGCAEMQKVQRQDLSGDAFSELSGGELRTIQEESPVLKAHMRNGEIYIFDQWQVHRTSQSVSGTGRLLNAQREAVREGDFELPISSVALFETNRLSMSKTIAPLVVFTGITGGVAAYCAAHPKTCFGSCPTFYVIDGDSLRLQAEGFSASIAPALEASDVDALYHARPSGGGLDVEMRNEALETHVVRSVELLAVKRRSGQRVFADSQGRFWQSRALLSPVVAQAPEGDCRQLLAEADGRERFSGADSTDLATKEVIELRFEGVSRGHAGLVVHCRQTLMSTYLLYQAFAYMGTRAGYWLAQVERGELHRTKTSMAGLLGGIEVLIQDPSGHWRLAGSIDEQGPLATDVHLVSVGELVGGSAAIRLRMTRGNWRIDQVALATLADPVEAIVLQPERVLRDGTDDRQARRALLDPAQTLTTVPGDRHILRYTIPDSASDSELFLRSRGYYIEWIRAAWMREENPALLAQMFLDPRAALKRLAPEFSRVEPDMEACFWGSRYAKP